jgi:ribosomal protein L22
MNDETPEIEQAEEEPKRRRRKKPASEAASPSEPPRQESGRGARRRKGTRVATEPEPASSPAEPEAPVAGSPAGVDPQAEEKAAEAVAEESAVEEAEGVEEAAAEQAAEEPKAAEAPEVAEQPEAAEQPAAAEEPEAAEEAKPRAHRRARRGAEATQAAPTIRRRRREEPRRDVVVRAQAKYVRTSARKARLVCDHIRGKTVEEARAILTHAPRAVARDWSKVLESAVANAEHNHELIAEDLYIKAVHADEGPTIKRYRPRALGRATRIRKRTSHLTILLTPKP